MIINTLHIVFILIGLGMAVVVFTVLSRVSAPYGRHIRRGWGPLLPTTLGWIIMETPAALIFALTYLFGTVSRNLPIIFFLALWELHYLHRAFIYPFTIRSGDKKMPLAVILMGFAFNLGNAYANGHYLFIASGGYPQAWVEDARFVIGVSMFLAGLVINRWSDLELRNLRTHGEVGYRIPAGGLFRWVSCPNYLGEIIEWSGWALATWSLPGLAFAVWTIANLAPRARSHHTWYHANFDGYPRERKALIPFFW